jgi:hypothetical protein
MKKGFLILFLLIPIFIFSHEVAFLYTVFEEDDSNQTLEKGWNLNFVALRWGNNDFSNYALSLKITNFSTTYTKVEVDQAWLKLPVYENLHLRVGKQIHDFSALSKSGSC